MSQFKHSTLCILAPLLLLTGACSKIDAIQREMKDNPTPAKPFSIDCQLYSYDVGDVYLKGSMIDNPPTIRLQLNPIGQYYRVTGGTGYMPINYQELFKKSKAYQTNADKDISTIFSDKGSWVPYLGGWSRSTRPYRVDGKQRLILEEANEVQFREKRGHGIPVMTLDTKERQLVMRYEWAIGSDYREYQLHREAGPASFNFSCARSPDDTVIEVDGFNQ